ncbi:MAG: undecaprenyl-diphosphate phosphatase [Verrucomicrobia bacterium]|nr:undecaprenyl-diphosphate phosphatase [Verrucomicrobiota bacterium]
MSLLQAFILGLIQGITEFLPISSSAHLKLAKLCFGLDGSESCVLFDLLCHLGTLIAVVIALRHEILALFGKDRKKLLLLFCAMMPLIPCYFVLKPVREFASQPACLGFCLIGTALILFAGQRWQRISEKDAKWSHALWIGTLQSAALIPGISRSASTISCARMLGWKAREAVRFSFLLSIPTIIGGNFLELLKIYVTGESTPLLPLSSCLIGFVTALTFGLIIVRFALRILEKGNLKPFAWYCLGCGVIVSLLFAGGLLHG